jgi:uncharacterized protein YoxC
MEEKCKKTVLIIKQKLKSAAKFENAELVTKLNRLWDDMNNKMKLIEFVRDCDSGAGPSNCKSMTKSSF